MKKANYVARELEIKIKKYLKLPEILAIVGPRRSGKTTFLRHLQANISDCEYISFENEVILDMFDLAIDDFAARYLRPNKCLIIDEFQHAKKGGKNLKYLFDTFLGKKIIISGSSSPDLTIKALRFLTGRCLVFELLPFSFTEFLVAQELEPVKSELPRFFDEFATFGGYPEVVLQKDPEVKKTLLQNIYSIFFSREVEDLTRLVDDYKLKNLLRALALNPGNLVEYQELSAISGFDFLSLKKYLNFLEKTFITFPVRPFYSNRRVELVKNPKIYFYDLGLRNSLIDNFLLFDHRPDKGNLAENFVALALKRAGGDLHFWRTKNKTEVDFVWEEKGKLAAYEVKAGKETNVSAGLASFIQKYHPKKAFVVNEQAGKTRKVTGGEVKFIPMVDL